VIADQDRKCGAPSETDGTLRSSAVRELLTSPLLRHRHREPNQDGQDASQVPPAEESPGA
jgi:hypothetical protein